MSALLFVLACILATAVAAPAARAAMGPPLIRVHRRRRYVEVTITPFLDEWAAEIRAAGR